MAKRRGAALVCSVVALGASTGSAPVADADTGLTRSSPFLGYRSSVEDQYTSPAQAQAASTNPARPKKAKKGKKARRTSRQPRVTRSRRQAGGGSVNNERVSAIPVRRRAPSAGAVAGTLQTPHGRSLPLTGMDLTLLVALGLATVGAGAFLRGGRGVRAALARRR